MEPCSHFRRNNRIDCERGDSVSNEITQVVKSSNITKRAKSICPSLYGSKNNSTWSTNQNGANRPVFKYRHRKENITKERFCKCRLRSLILLSVSKGDYKFPSNSSSNDTGQLPKRPILLLSRNDIIKYGKLSTDK